MRRTVLVAIAVLMAGMPAAGAKPKPPPVGVSNLLIGPANTALDVTIPKGAKLVVNAPARGVARGFAELVDLSGSNDAWAAVALISRTHKVGGKPVMAAQVHAPRPDHCPSDFAPTVAPVPACDAHVEHTSVHGVTPVLRAGRYEYALPAGTYQVVISGPPRTYLAAFFSFTGARGRAMLMTRQPVAAAFDRVRSADLAAARADGYFGRRISANGVAILGVWHTSAGDEPGAHTYAECLTPGNSIGPLNPDDCAAVAASGQAPPAALGPKPMFHAGSTEPVTLDNAGTATFQTPVLKPGTYFNTYRVTRGGRGPAAGAFAWWLLADSLK